MEEPTQEQYLDNALDVLEKNLVQWGIDDYMGYRKGHILRLSVSGATNLVALVNTLNNEIAQLEQIIKELPIENEDN